MVIDLSCTAVAISRRMLYFPGVKFAGASTIKTFLRNAPNVAIVCILFLISGAPADSEAVHVKFDGGLTKVVRLRTGVSFFISPDRTLKSIPAEMKDFRYTQRDLSADVGIVSLDVPPESTAYVIFCSDRDESSLLSTLSKTGWTRLQQVIKVSSPNFNTFNVFKRSFDNATHVDLDGKGLKCTIMIASQKLKVEGGEKDVK